MKNCTGLRSYTRAMRYPHKKNLQIDKSGTRSGQGMSANLEMRNSPKRGRRMCIDALAVWTFASSCWSHTRPIDTHFCRNSDTIKLLIIWTWHFGIHGHSIFISLKKNKAQWRQFFQQTTSPSLWGYSGAYHAVLSNFQEPNNGSFVDSLCQ